MRELLEKIGLAELQLREVKEAADEGLTSLTKMRDELDEGNEPSEQTIDYLGGDAYELEQRAERAVQTTKSVADDAEAINEE